MSEVEEWMICYRLIDLYGRVEGSLTPEETEARDEKVMHLYEAHGIKYEGPKAYHELKKMPAVNRNCRRTIA